MRARRNSPIANELGDVADLLPDEQSELAVKLRYGIGLEQLLATAVRPPLQRPAPSKRTEPTREPDAGSRARIAAMGIGAGSRGQWLRR